MPPSQQSPLRVLLAALVAMAACGMEGGPPASVDSRNVSRHAAAGSYLAGENAQYAYDGAGNITQITAAQVAPLSITGFQPQQGVVGQTVTVMGAGFSPLPANNAVTLNGLAAAMLSSSATEIVFSVPTGATTGPISVTSAGKHRNQC